MSGRARMVSKQIQINPDKSGPVQIARVTDVASVFSLIVGVYLFCQADTCAPAKTGAHLSPQSEQQHQTGAATMPTPKRQHEASPVLFCPLCHCTLAPGVDPDHRERCPFPAVARFASIVQRARKARGIGASGHP